MMGVKIRVVLGDLSWRVPNLGTEGRLQRVNSSQESELRTPLKTLVKAKKCDSS